MSATVVAWTSVSWFDRRNWRCGDATVVSGRTPSLRPVTQIGGDAARPEVGDQTIRKVGRVEPVHDQKGLVQLASFGDKPGVRAPVRAKSQRRISGPGSCGCQRQGRVVPGGITGRTMRDGYWAE